MNSKQKGSLAVSHCIAKLYEEGYEVFIPIGDRLKYDLIFDDGKELWKVQVKYAGLTTKNKCIVGLRTTGGNQSFNYARKYDDSSFDYLYVFTAKNEHYLIKWSDIKARNELSIEAKKFDKYKI